MIMLGENGFDEAPQILALAEEELLRWTSGSDIVWCGRGATALYWAFRLAGIRRPDVKQPEVIMPSILCATPANVAIMAGLKPRFADINHDNALTNVSHVNERLTERTVAVLFVHLYGHTDTVDELASLSNNKNLLLIEDAAQALGGRLPDGQRVGSIGDCSIFSFSHTKILECGGGALVLRSPELVNFFSRLVASTPAIEKKDLIEIKQLSESFRNLQHAMISMLRLRMVDHCADWFAPLATKYAHLFIAPLIDPKALATDWDNLAENLDHRIRMARRYSERLADGPWKLPVSWEHSGVCWRYTLLLEEEKRLIPTTERLRQAGFLASNHYWPLHQFYFPKDHCQAAEHFARSCLNLWVDCKVDLDTVDRCADFLWKLSEEL